MHSLRASFFQLRVHLPKSVLLNNISPLLLADSSALKYNPGAFPDPRKCEERR
jgi:hypothetical protein